MRIKRDAKSPSGLRDWRKAHKLTQKQLAKELGVDHTTISRWESHTISIEHPEILAMALKYYASTHLQPLL